MIMINNVKSTPINYWNTKSQKIYSLNIQIFLYCIYNIYKSINHKNFPLFSSFILPRSNPFTPIYIPICKFIWHNINGVVTLGKRWKKSFQSYFFWKYIKNHVKKMKNYVKAGYRNRTDDHRITNAML